MPQQQEVKGNGTNGGDKRKAGEDDDKRKTRETTQTLKEGLSEETEAAAWFQGAEKTMTKRGTLQHRIVE